MYLDCINDNFTFNMTSDNVFEVSMYLDCIGNLIILNAHMMKSTHILKLQIYFETKEKL